MFQGCTSLTMLDISSFDFDSITTYRYMFYGGSSTTIIYVKDGVAQSKILNLGSSERPLWSTSNVIVKTNS